MHTTQPATRSRRAPATYDPSALTARDLVLTSEDVPREAADVLDPDRKKMERMHIYELEVRRTSGDDHYKHASPQHVKSAQYTRISRTRALRLMTEVEAGPIPIDRDTNTVRVQVADDALGNERYVNVRTTPRPAVQIGAARRRADA